MTDQSNKYVNYFDEEEELIETQIKNKQKNRITEKLNDDKKSNEKNFSKSKVNESEDFKFLNNENKKSPKTNKMESSPKSSDSNPKNSEYKIPFPKNKLKKENESSNSPKEKIEKNIVVESNAVDQELSDPIEYYENLEDLIKANNDDENMEYDLVGMDELQNYLVGGIEDFDFDYKKMMIEEPAKEIEKFEKDFAQDPLNYETLYKLIYLYRETKNQEKLKYFRNYTQMYFPISDDMWKDWIKDELIDINKNNPDNFDLKVQLIDIFERALRDFYCKLFFNLLFKNFFP